MCKPSKAAENLISNFAPKLIETDRPSALRRHLGTPGLIAERLEAGGAHASPK